MNQMLKQPAMRQHIKQMQKAHPSPQTHVNPNMESVKRIQKRALLHINRFVINKLYLTFNIEKVKSCNLLTFEQFDN